MANFSWIPDDYINADGTPKPEHYEDLYGYLSKANPGYSTTGAYFTDDQFRQHGWGDVIDTVEKKYNSTDGATVMAAIKAPKPHGSTSVYTADISNANGYHKTLNINGKTYHYFNESTYNNDLQTFFPSSQTPQTPQASDYIQAPTVSGKAMREKGMNYTANIGGRDYWYRSESDKNADIAAYNAYKSRLDAYNSFATDAKYLDASTLAEYAANGKYDGVDESYISGVLGDKYTGYRATYAGIKQTDSRTLEMAAKATTDSSQVASGTTGFRGRTTPAGNPKYSAMIDGQMYWYDYEQDMQYDLANHPQTETQVASADNKNPNKPFVRDIPVTDDGSLPKGDNPNNNPYSNMTAEQLADAIENGEFGSGQDRLDAFKKYGIEDKGQEAQKIVNSRYNNGGGNNGGGETPATKKDPVVDLASKETVANKYRKEDAEDLALKQKINHYKLLKDDPNYQDKTAAEKEYNRLQKKYIEKHPETAAAGGYDSSVKGEPDKDTRIKNAIYHNEAILKDPTSTEEAKNKARTELERLKNTDYNGEYSNYKVKVANTPRQRWEKNIDKLEAKVKDGTITEEEKKKLNKYYKLWNNRIAANDPSAKKYELLTGLGDENQSIEELEQEDAKEAAVEDELKEENTTVEENKEAVSPARNDTVTGTSPESAAGSANTGGTTVNTLEISPEGIRALITRINTAAENLVSTWNSMVNVDIASLDGVWIGTDAQAYIEKIKAFQNKIMLVNSALGTLGTTYQNGLAVVEAAEQENRTII